VYQLYFDPDDDEFVLAWGADDPPTTFGVRGDVGCFMGR
jgi:hypothetical protein